MLLALLAGVALFFALRAVAILVLLCRGRARMPHEGSVRLRRRASRTPAGESDALSSASAAASASSRPVRTLIVLGSGGHTAEMLAVLDAVPRAHYAPLLFVRAATDAASEARAVRMETERGNQHQCTHRAIHRSREVGQSYITSVWSTLRALAHSVHIVLEYKPELLLCNGPGTCVPLCYAAFLCRVFLFRPCSLVFIESFCRVRTLSLSGILLYPIADEMIVQWPQLDAHRANEMTTTRDAHQIDAGSEQQQQQRSQAPSDSAWRYVKYIGRLC